jgi:hypothetical protein
LGDVSAISRAAAPATFGLFVTLWFTSSEDSSLRPVFAVATTVALICTCAAWFAYALRSRMRQGLALAVQGAALCGICSMMLLLVIAGWYQDSVRSSVREEVAEKARADEDAARDAAAQIQLQAQIAQEAAARALAAKDEAIRESEKAAARIAEAQCLQARDDAVQKAQWAQASARKAVDDCKAQYEEQLIAFKTVREYCKSGLARLESARAQLSEAKAKGCSTEITGSIDKPK